MNNEEMNRIAHNFYKKLSKLINESDDKYFGLYTVVLIDTLAHIIAKLDIDGDMNKECISLLEIHIDKYK